MQRVEYFFEKEKKSTSEFTYNGAKNVKKGKKER